MHGRRIIGQGARLLAGALALYALATGAGAAALRARVQEGLFTHLERGEECMREGRLAEARAQADLVLLTRAVRVKADFENVPYDLQFDCRWSLLEAASLWEQELDGVRFEFVEDGPADVTVSYAPSVRFGGREAAGCVTWRRSVLNLNDEESEYEMQAEIQLRYLQPNGRTMRHEVLRHAAAHELGHVLGLADSPRDGDIMGRVRLNRPAARPTIEEVAALREVRSEAEQLRQLASEPIPIGTGWVVCALFELRP